MKVQFLKKKILNKYGLFQSVARRKPLLSKKNETAWLRFVELHQNKPQNFLNNVLWTDEIRVEMFSHKAQHDGWRKPNTAYQLCALF